MTEKTSAALQTVTCIQHYATPSSTPLARNIVWKWYLYRSCLVSAILVGYVTVTDIFSCPNKWEMRDPCFPPPPPPLQISYITTKISLHFQPERTVLKNDEHYCIVHMLWWRHRWDTGWTVASLLENFALQSLRTKGDNWRKTPHYKLCVGFTKHSAVLVDLEAAPLDKTVSPIKIRIPVFALESRNIISGKVLSDQAANSTGDGLIHHEDGERLKQRWWRIQTSDDESMIRLEITWC